ncbi:MAG: ferrous iron transport protein A [Candidatus Cloacimonetes bacterium]|nr:ferrous iron transport protein A [Candidatus Cloacimonadota bacterium]MCF7815249.1 ferrous iron transport protein A [Candidatus Cloacimonadota bacterium]MCF7868469.1 ferrous iron transport protein A [Candidatus Cloacimonadota bacterium]MCF7883911.1 ferrous iron transport protein A [Candidatus Cloacimonadota bacterium]
MFGFRSRSGKGKRHGKHCRQHKRRFVGEYINLTEAEVGKKYIIMKNPDVKTMEMGLYRSGIITVHKNEAENSNIVVGVGESRYIIPRDLAEKIKIR